MWPWALNSHVQDWSEFWSPGGHFGRSSHILQRRCESCARHLKWTKFIQQVHAVTAVSQHQRERCVCAVVWETCCICGKGRTFRVEGSHVLAKISISTILVSQEVCVTKPLATAVRWRGLTLETGLRDAAIRARWRYQRLPCAPDGAERTD